MSKIEMFSQNSMVKALPSGNSLARGFATISPTLIRPDYAYGQNQTSTIATGVQVAADGYIKWGHEGFESPARIKLIPYCEDNPGAQFSLRLYAWQQMAIPDASGMIWVPSLLVELLCTAGALPGIQGRWVKQSENFCEQITLSKGILGPWYGAIWSYAIGSGLGAFAIVDTVGARFLSFDFAMTDPAAATGMNCLWCRA